MENQNSEQRVVEDEGWTEVRDVMVQEVWDEENGQLKQALEVEERQRYLACKKCDKILLNDNELRAHLKEHNRLQQKIIKCDYCDFTTTDANIYIRHVPDVHSQKHTCNTCAAEFNSKKEMVDHAGVEHELVYTQQTNRPLFPCGFCPQGFETQHAFNIHIQEKHTKSSAQTESGPNYECYDCGSMCNSKPLLMEHKRQSDYKKTLCSFWHGNGNGCRFPAPQCINIHNENIVPTVTNDNRKRIECRNGSLCFYNRTNSCHYKHSSVPVQSVPTLASTVQTPLPTQAESAGPQAWTTDKGLESLRDVMVKMNINVENLSERLKTMEQHAMKDFQQQENGQGIN